MDFAGAAFYEPPFTHLHSGGPDALFAGKEKVIDGIFTKLQSLEPDDPAKTG